MNGVINQNRLIQTLLQLIGIDSHSRKEGKIAAFLAEKLRNLGGDVCFDDAGEKVKGEVGNLIAIFEGDPSKPAMLLSAHMDTVVPGEGVTPVVSEKIIKSDGRTVLGGDDKSGLAIILEVIQKLKENKDQHGKLEVVFTICEEAGLLGAKLLDISRFNARYGLVLDSDDAGFLFTRAPSSSRLEFRIFGLESHAGMAPEKGLSAIQLAGMGISKMKLGRIDSETTANLGKIEGGSAVNIVPNRVTIEGEARSHNDEKLERQIEHMVDCFEKAASENYITVDGRLVRGRVEKNIYRDYNRMDLSDSTAIVRLVLRAAQNRHLSVQTRAMGGGCDANIFNQKGIQVANLGTGMRNIHSLSEYLIVDEFLQAAEIIYEVLRVNGEKG
ncbi:MAG: M20/M25/M40 family metallo-hydrolase [Nitrospirae bacterium]|nr:M20/M25/M40 family metallo-hydrolase [Nitrospirota bacterium]MBI3594181.1 M20/M25/M40 family metallo-hydrolase [Nitrospirota bacterium]